MNYQDDVITWEDITTSMAEVRPLLTTFKMLEETVEQKCRATRLIMLVLLTLLCVVVEVLVFPNSLSFRMREIVFAVGVVITFGLISISIVYFNLAACAKNTQTARRSLERELKAAEDNLVNTLSDKLFSDYVVNPSSTHPSVGRGDYA